MTRNVSAPRSLIVASLIWGCFALSSAAQSAQDQSQGALNPISNTQLAGLLSVDYQLRQLSNDWLEVNGAEALFYAYAKPNFPGILFRMAWPNNIDLNPAEVNVLNNQLSHGALQLNADGSELVLEFTVPYFGEKPNGRALLKAVAFFEAMIDTTVGLVAEI